MSVNHDSLLLLMPPLVPWLIVLLVLTLLAVMIILFLKQRGHLERNTRSAFPANLEKLDLLYTLVDSMPDWIYIKDRESRFILANKHLAGHHGILNPEEITGHTDFEFYPEEMARGFYDDEQRIMESGIPIVNKEEMIVDNEGNEIILSTTKIPVKDQSGNVVGIVGIGRNITRQKQDQMRLKELSMVASGTENVVVIMDREGNFRWVNKGFEKKYGTSLEDFIRSRGKNLKQNSSNEKIEEYLEEIQRTKIPFTYTTRTQDADSNDAWFQTHITPILNEEGEIISMFLIDVDITALKKADLQIKQQKYELEFQRDQLRILNASKDRLFSIIAHDLKNPFQVIIGFSELLKDEFRTMKLEQAEDYLECIYHSSTSAFDLLYNLLEWARAQTRSIKVVPVPIKARDLTREIADLFSVQLHNKEIELANNLAGDLVVVTDRNILQTVLRNLIANAIKYTDKKGRISVSGLQNDPYVKISVTDTGIGMSEDKIRTLFSLEKGKSTPGTSGESGTGLGLLVSHDFLGLVKGFFKVESKIGKGSTFTICLPVKPG